MRSISSACAFLALTVTPSIGAPQTVSIGDTLVVEGDAGTRDAVFTVMLSAPAGGPVTVAYATRDGLATSASDYQVASGTLAFAKGDRSKTITVPVFGDATVEQNEPFAMVLSGATGGTLAGDKATATIINDDFPDRAARPPAGGKPPGGGDPRWASAYEVRFTFRGYSGSQAGNDCPGARPNGKVTLTGLLFGNENVYASENIDYDGVLQLESNIDLCEAKQTSDGDAYCVIGVVGSGLVDANFSLKGDDRGAYIQSTLGANKKTVTAAGNCGSAANADEVASYPDNSAANPLNGTEFKLNSRPLRLGSYTDGDITLEVLRAFKVVAPAP